MCGALLMSCRTSSGGMSRRQADAQPGRAFGNRRRSNRRHQQPAVLQTSPDSATRIRASPTISGTI